jgi:hypothetical protein
MNDAKKVPYMSKRIKSMLNQEVTSETKAEPETPLSVAAVQEAAVSAPIQADIRAPEAGQSTPHLETETEIEPVQNLDSAENSKITGGAENGPESLQETPFSPPAGDLAELGRALAESREQEQPVKPVFDQKKHEAMMAEIERSTNQYATDDCLGMQADSSLRVAITIAEEYVSGVEEAARTDGRTVDEWTTERFAEYLEAYYSPAKGR